MIRSSGQVPTLGCPFRAKRKPDSVPNVEAARVVLFEDLEVRPGLQATDAVDPSNTFGQCVEIVGRVGGDRCDDVVATKRPSQELDSRQRLDFGHGGVVAGAEIYSDA